MVPIHNLQIGTIHFPLIDRPSLVQIKAAQGFNSVSLYAAAGSRGEREPGQKRPFMDGN